MQLAIEEYTPAHRTWARDLLQRRWGSARVVSRGRVHQADDLPGFVARLDGVESGLVTYRLDGDACEVVTLDSTRERHGVGSALLAAVERAAAPRCRRIWLVTTNDNTPALRFYQRHGFTIAAIHQGAIVESRRLKPEIPERGFDGIAIQDEIELERLLPGS